MPIKEPHPHLFDSVKLEVAKAKLGHLGRKSLYAPLNLVAYIDMMTMLVIFLLMSFSATGDFKIPELHDKLVTLKNNYKLLHPGEEFNGIAIIQSDKNVEFKMLKKIMYSASVAGYQNVNFAVTPKAKGGAAAAPAP